MFMTNLGNAPKATLATPAISQELTRSAPKQHSHSLLRTSTLQQLFARSTYQHYLLAILVLLGCFFRLFHFVYNRSFFIDELFLSTNLVKLSFWRLFHQPLLYQQKAPIGYLVISHILVLLFGKHESALRLFPLLSGLTGLLLFVPVARTLLRPWAAVLAVGFLSLGYPAIYHSVEAKQYSTELCATVVALYIYCRMCNMHQVGPLLGWGVLGALLPWFSFPTIFVLLSVGLALCLQAIRHKSYIILCWHLFIGFIWLFNFGLVYYFFMSKYHDSGWLNNFFTVKYDAYLPLEGFQRILNWSMHKYYDFLSHPLGVVLEVDNQLNYHGFKHFLKMGWVYPPLMLAGAYFLFRKNISVLCLLLIPVVVVLLTSALHIYPFYQRFTLFLTPVIILLIAYGAQQISHSFPRCKFTYPLLVLLLLPPFINSAHHVVAPDSFYNREYYRDVLFYVNDHFQTGDAVYVYWNMHQAYDYYKEAYPLKYTAVRGSLVKHDAHSQAEYLQLLKKDFASFKGKKRVWLIYDTNNRDAIGDYVDLPAWYHDPAFPPGRLLNMYFAGIGTQLRSYQRGFYVATLYALP